jgi:hypothetical protein
MVEKCFCTAANSIFLLAEVEGTKTPPQSK